MRRDGLTLLLRFALGSVKAGDCGSKEFGLRIVRFLRRENNQRGYFQREIPNQLKTAWPKLVKLSKKTKKDPLDWKTVSVYVLGNNPDSHNSFVLPECQVIRGEVIEILHSPRGGRLMVKELNAKKMKLKKVKFVGFLDDGLEEGDIVVYHREYFVAKVED